jgi:hypothetical protein
LRQLVWQRHYNFHRRATLQPFGQVEIQAT